MKQENNRFYILILTLFLLCLYGKYSAQTVEAVRSEINRLKIDSSEIVLKQSVLETGWYKSYSCKHRNNLFGFRWKGKYLEFDTWQESVQYYARWQDRHFKGGDYYKFLKDRGYATDPEYINKLKQIKL